MLDRIIRFALDNRPVVVVCALLLMIAGIYTARRMEVDVFPDLNAPTVVVMTEARGMAPEEVERLVTFPIETALNGSAGIRRVRSSSTTGFSVVWAEFDWGTEIYRARQTVSEKLAVVREGLPREVGSPTLGPQSSILGEVMIVGLSGDSVPLQELRTLADWTVRPRLLATGGVAQVAVIGGEIKEYQIALDPDRMRRYGVTLDEALEATRDMNRNAPGGTLYEHGNEYIIRGALSTNDMEALGKAAVGSVRLENVATVGVGSRSPRLGAASERGKAAVLVTVTKQPAASTMELTGRLDRALAELQGELPAGVHLSTDIFRQARFIESSVNNVQKSLYEGAVFVVIVLLLFLMNVRTTVISLVTIPLSLVVSILVLRAMGLTINTMSLGGMAIAIGSIVDDAIVDVENVFRHLRENRALPPQERQSVMAVVFEASREVRMPILNSTLIIIACFAPLFFLTGMEGRMLAPLGIAFVTALAASTLVALTLTPALCSYMLGRGGKEREPWLTRQLKQLYGRALRWSLHHKRAVLGATGGLLLATVVVFCSLGRNFLPPFNEGSLTINLSAMPGISLEESEKIGLAAEQLLLSVPEVQTVGRKTGRAELDEHVFGTNVSEFETPFVLKGRTKEAMIEDIRCKLSDLPGLNVEIGQPISHRIDHMLSGAKAGVAIKIFGSDLSRMYSIGNRIKAAAAEVPGVVDLNVEQQVERPQLKIEPRRELLARYGMTLPEFARAVEVMLGGETVSQVYENGRTFDLILKVKDDARATADRLADMAVDAGGSKVPLGSLARIVSTSGPNVINRENVERKTVVSANVAGRDMRSVVNDIRRRVEASVELPEGYRIEYGGQFESEQAASRTLTTISLAALLVVFLLLFGQFRNAAQSALILLNLPLALIGGVMAIFLTGSVLSIPAIIGFISLFGIATRNGMLLIARYNDLRAAGATPEECVMRGSLDRLNPILMTALCSALALIPLALGGSLPGNEIQSPMARVILGGLLTSTLLNGFIIPIVYLLTTRKK
ncbi:MAG: CusA/CzcA family heavy metal efflux RND transporter [Rikenellaceae bacterium]|jgi:Cu(I)/Ag(I) efflux system membrane protein CusA/SilA|nr:CusA/CzcA family heavy metal efflux RND transporter [Rikenellaceae bacterium]